MKQTFSIVILLALMLSHAAAKEISKRDVKIQRILVGTWKGTEGTDDKLKTYIFSKTLILTKVSQEYVPHTYYAPKTEKVYMVKNKQLIVGEEVFDIKIMTKNLIVLTDKKQTKITLARQ